MDADSKLLATRMELAAKGFDEIAAHIDQRYQITYGHVEQGPKDDPMGIFALVEQELPEPVAASTKNTNPEQQPDYNDQHLDAFGKGKGKGFMSNGGRCNVCNGEGHIARDCPSSPGQDGKATGDTCYGCSGKGHQKAVCPTANPQLKGGGKGKGGWQQDGGKGKGGGLRQTGGWQQKGGKGKRRGKRQGMG